ncbi:ribosomal protein S18-alanine N-acetyltransferase [uncultured Limosilactobacillus sp.]|uniref:ribosomal protein S18-alanine N-acetyltransferase n=1 Tax=uncultured Limosilactobacillus sp. TaxID=2837629 RepID=UPI0025E85283|nr:ribosomal protein S18-alanine N-acetyltransferase [uncultured Limosilactobacillus sp.]
MFKKFNRWFAGFLDDVNGKPVHYTDHNVVIGRRYYRLVQGRTLDIHQLLQTERLIYGSLPWDRTAFEIDINRPNTLYLLLIEADSKRLVAFIGAAFNAYLGDVHITNLGVIPEFQMHGLGTFLLQEVERKARLDGFTSMSLEVRRSNLTAQRLYRQLGFIQVRIRQRYYRDNGEDAFDMLKKIEGEGN